MNMRVVAAAIAVASVLSAAPHANGSGLPVAPSQVTCERHHYTMSARVRPLLFWIGKDDVGDAVIVKRRDADTVGYSLLIGSDPNRAPRRINRWGYIDEEIRGHTATLLGLMTESDEESVSEAEANLHKQSGQRVFDVIHASIADGEARSIVTSVAASADYTLRQVDALVELAGRTSGDGEKRVLRLPDGTRPGFLAAVADLIHAQISQWRTLRQAAPSDPITYVYHGKLYQLRVTHAHSLARIRVGETTYEHAIASRFEVKNMRDGQLTDFSMTYAADGPLAETPLTVRYQPRWWLEIQLTLDDRTTGPILASEHAGLNP